MSFDNPRCKAFCEKIEDLAWAVAGLGILVLWVWFVWWTQQ